MDTYELKERSIKITPVVGGYLLLLPRGSQFPPSLSLPDLEAAEDLEPFGSWRDIFRPIESIIFCDSLQTVAARLIELEEAKAVADYTGPTSVAAKGKAHTKK